MKLILLQLLDPIRTIEAPLLPFIQEIRRIGIHTEQYLLPTIYGKFPEKDNAQKVANEQIREALD
jgi:hypothetical protein